MLDYNSDIEQAEALQTWWRQSRIKIFLGISVLLGSIYGYQEWQAKQKQQKLAAAENFYQLALTDNAALAKQLIAEHKGSVYAEMSQLWQAKQHVANKSYDEALTIYNAIINNSNKPALVQLAKWYKIHVLVEQKQFKKALTELNKFTENADIVNELRGDIYVLEAKKSLAFSAYTAAIDAANDPLIKKRITLKQQNIYQTP